MTSQIYLDHNATTPLDLEVANDLQLALRQLWVNPASQHRMGQAARRCLENQRSDCLRLLGADVHSFPADQLLFCSGGTEANNLVIFGHARRNTQLIVSSIEHPSVLQAAEHAALVAGAQLSKIKVDEHGVCRLEHLVELLSQGPTSLVSMMLVNNETGVIQPVAEAAQICRQLGVLMHSDAVQAVGKIPLSFRELGVDLMTFSPHKFHGPRGIGGLIMRPGSEPRPLLHGGVQQRGLRPGTEDVALAVGCRSALEKCLLRLPENGPRWAFLANHFWNLLGECLGSYPVWNGMHVPRAPHTINVAFPGVDRQALMLAADAAGLALSTGSACASGSSERSPVLIAMGLPDSLLDSSLRLSFGQGTSVEEIERAATILVEIVRVLRG